MSIMHGPHTLPEARLHPKDGADRLAILKGQVRDGARTTGRVAAVAAKTLAMVCLCGAGLFAVGSGRTRNTYELDRQLDRLRQMNESTMRLLNQPKIEWDNTPRSFEFRTPTIQIEERLLTDRHLEWSLPEPTTRVQSPAVSSQPPSAQQRATLSP
jgi:hypothetical protein